MNFINRNEIADGVFFTNVKDSRFKTMKISVNIVVPLSIETASENALVGGLLVRSCKKYPDFTVLSLKFPFRVLMTDILLMMSALQKSFRSFCAV